MGAHLGKKFLIFTWNLITITICMFKHRMWHLFLSHFPLMSISLQHKDNRMTELESIPSYHCTSHLWLQNMGFQTFTQWRYSVFQVEHQSVNLTLSPNRDASVFECWLSNPSELLGNGGKWKIGCWQIHCWQRWPTHWMRTSWNCCNFSRPDFRLHWNQLHLSEKARHKGGNSGGMSWRQS